jgi:hypothetical protein
MRKRRYVLPDWRPVLEVELRDSNPDLLVAKVAPDAQPIQTLLAVRVVHGDHDRRLRAAHWGPHVFPTFVAVVCCTFLLYRGRERSGEVS